MQADIKRRFPSWLGILVLILLTEKPAQAYLDPGTGNALVQAFFAAIMATLATVGFYWRSARDYVTRLRRRHSGTHSGGRSQPAK